MNIRLGVFDLFSRIVPGGFYLFVFGEFARVTGWVKFDWVVLQNIGVLPSLGLIIIAYILGTAMDHLGYLWHRIFRKRGSSDRALERFKELYGDRWEIDFEDKDWHILRAYIYIHNPSVAEEIDRFNAVSIMLRNLSLGLTLLAVNEVIQFISTSDWKFLILVVVLLYFSVQVAIQARNQRAWFYTNIFEVSLAYQLNLEERLKPMKTSTRKKAGE